MKIKLKVSRAGPGISDVPGDEIDVPQAEALRMIKAGQAVAVKQSRAKAVTQPAEKAVVD